MPGPTSTGTKTSTTTNQQITPPIAGGPTSISSPFGEPNHGTPPHVHMGMDVPVPTGTACYAPVDGKIQYASAVWDSGGMVHFQFLSDLGSIKKGDVIGWGHVKNIRVREGQTVTGGTHLCDSNHPAPHVHFIYQTPVAPGTSDGTDDPHDIYLQLAKGQAPGHAGNTEAGATDVTGTGSIESISKAAAISAFLDLPGILDQTESLALTGERSLMNDQPLLPFIEQLCQASLRNFMSMPNGNFYAFFPDYFGGLNHRTAYWEISDIEVLDGTINLSDDALATHVYVIGDNAAPFGVGSIDLIDEMQSAGVVNVFNAFMADFMNGTFDPALEAAASTGAHDGGGQTSKSTQEQYQKQIQSVPTLADKDKALSFLQKYGARPYREDAPMVRSPFFEMFLAYQKFCLLWSQQFLTTFEFTFMPELFPGGLVAFPDHGIQCYIDEVVHEGSYETGFTTRANLNAPSALRDGDGNPTGPRVNINEGMIRAGVFSAGGAGVGTSQAKSGKNNSG